MFSTSINKILLDAQIKEYNTNLSTTPNTCDESHKNTNILPTAPQLPSLNRNHPLSLVPRNFRNLALVNIANSRPNHIQSAIQHIVTQHSENDDTYEQIIEQPHTTKFQSQNNHFFSPPCADNLDPFTVPFRTQPTSKTQFPSSHFLLSSHPDHPTLTHHAAWILTLIQTSPFLIQFPNLITQTSRPQTNLQTPNPAHQHFPNPHFDLFNPSSQIIPPQPFLIFPK